MAERRRLVRGLVTDFLRLPVLIQYIGTSGSARILNREDRGMRTLTGGLRKPESTLELYRFISDYFRSRIR